MPSDAKAAHSPSVPPAAFELRAVQKRFGKETALGPLALALPESGTSVLIGPSGSGKSTLLRLLNGLILPDEGEVFFRGLPMTDLLAHRQQQGYVIQGGGLFPHLNAEGNCALVARYLGWDEARISARIDELSTLVRLPRAALARRPAQLSGGQAQRVSLMRALMLDPGVLLLDEPLGALDPITRYELQEDLRAAFARLQKTVVLVTHDLSEARFFGARIVLLRAGRVVQQGSFEEFASAPAEPFVTQFLRAQRAMP